MLIDGRDVRDCSLAWLREQVAVVLQDTVLFTGTVRENIAYGDRRDARGGRGRGARGGGARVHRRAADGLRHRARPAGRRPLRRPAPADRRSRARCCATRRSSCSTSRRPALDAESEARVLDGLQRADARAHDDPRSRTRRGSRATARPRSCELDRRRAWSREPRRAAPIPTLPQLERLLDAERDARVLARARSAASERSTSVEVGRVVYKPGDTVAVHYRARRRRRARTTPSRRGSPASTSPSAPAAALRGARAAGRRPLARPRPRRYDAELGALVTWLPFDPRLPALGRGARRARPAAARRALGGASPSCSATSRAPAPCCGSDGHVLKAYGARAPVRGGAAPACAPPRARRRCRPARSRRAAGAAADRAARRRGRAARRRRPRSPSAAGALVARAAARAARRPRPPRRPSACSPPRRARRTLVATVLPELRPRLDALRRAARHASCPPGSRWCPRTATSTSTSCCVGGDGIVVVDFDGMCLAAPALDLATYVADVVRGRDGDLEAVDDGARAAARRLRRPAARRSTGTWPRRSSARAAHPFQRQLPDWPERVDAMVRGGGGGRCLSARARHRLRRLHRLAPGRVAARRRRTRCSASTASTTTTRAAQKLANLARARDYDRFRLRRGRPRDRRPRARCSTAATSSSTSRPSRACARAGARRFDRYVRNNVVATQRLLEAVQAQRPAKRSSTRPRRRSTASRAAADRARTRRRGRSRPTA